MNIVEKAKNHKLNLSRITERALHQSMTIYTAKTNAKALYLLIHALFREKMGGPVAQSG